MVGVVFFNPFGQDKEGRISPCMASDWLGHTLALDVYGLHIWSATRRSAATVGLSRVGVCVGGDKLFCLAEQSLFLSSYPRPRVLFFGLSSLEIINIYICL